MACCVLLCCLNKQSLYQLRKGTGHPHLPTHLQHIRLSLGPDTYRTPASSAHHRHTQAGPEARIRLCVLYGLLLRPFVIIHSLTANTRLCSVVSLHRAAVMIRALFPEKSPSWSARAPSCQLPGQIQCLSPPGTYSRTLLLLQFSSLILPSFQHCPCKAERFMTDLELQGGQLWT